MLLAPRLVLLLVLWLVLGLALRLLPLLVAMLMLVGALLLSRAPMWPALSERALAAFLPLAQLNQSN